MGLFFGKIPVEVRDFFGQMQANLNKTCKFTI